MPSRLTVFVSSTIKDLAPVRRDLRAWFEARGIVVRMSEFNDFPVARGVDSHDACLGAIAGSNLYVLLVGERYGGRYKGTPKSITWREWDEAFSQGIPTITLVLRSANDKAQELARARGNAARLDKLREELPRDFEQLGKLIDELRKGHRDNWCYMDWDGSLSGATDVIETTMHNLICDMQVPHKKLVLDAQVSAARSAALRDMQAAVLELAESVRRGEQPLSDALGRMLALAASARRELYKFTDGDVWNLMLYRRDGQELVPWIRHCDKRIVRRERRWKVGEGHVGLAVSGGSTLVAGDLRLADGFIASHPEDARVYRSAVSVPLFGAPVAGGRKKPPGEPVGAFVVTSSRLDQFVEASQPEALTAEQTCTMLRMLVTAAPAEGARA